MAEALLPFWATPLDDELRALNGTDTLPSALLGFTPLPATLLAALGGIALLYALASELAKRVFYRHAAL
jgi:hypothetical protein